eukprot:gene19431-21353_t
MKRVFTIPERVHGGTNVRFSWQQCQGNYLAATGNNRVVTIYDRHGELKDEIVLPGLCNGMAWDKDGDTLAIINDKSGTIALWDASKGRTSQMESGLRDNLTFLSWSKNGKILAVGTSKGNLLIYNHQTSRKIPILGKHSKKITCGAWNSENLLALGSEDKSITISNADGDTLNQTSTRNEPSAIQFSVMKTDERASQSGETTVSLIVGKKTLYLYNIKEPDNPIELAFQPRYGVINAYTWFGDGYVMIGFSAGFLVVISTHIKEIGQELFQTRDHKDVLKDIGISLSFKKAASCGDNCVKIHDLTDMKEIYAIITLDDAGGQLDKMGWTEDGQLLAVSTEKGAIHVYLTKLPILGDAYNTKIAYLTSLREVTVIDEVNQERQMKVPTQIEPTFMAVGPYHLAVGMNNRVWICSFDEHGPSAFKDREYLGSIEQICLNDDYIAVLFENKVQIHLIDNEAGDVNEERETKLFPEGNDRSQILCCALTTDFLVYATAAGDIKYFYFEDWQYVIEFHHSMAIRKVFPGPVGTRLVFVDDKGDGFIYIPINDGVYEIANFPPTIKNVLWDNWLLDKGVFCAYDDEKVYLYVFSKETITGAMYTLASTTKLPYGNNPLMLYNGELTCQTQGGKLNKILLTIFGEDTKFSDETSDTINEGLEQALVMKRFKEAWSICSLLNEDEAWRRFAREAAKNLDIELAMQVYRKLGDVAMVLSLQNIKDIEDKNLIAGYVAMFLEDTATAQELFLASGHPVAALDMRRDLLHWDQALELSKTLAPSEIPFISKEYGQQLEFTGDYPSALMHYEKGITNQAENKEHDDACTGGIARMAIRMGDARRGVKLAMKSSSKQVKKECALLLDSMKQYNEAGALYEASQAWDKAAAVYIKTKNWSKVGDLMQYITSPKLLIQFAKAKEADKRYKESASAYKAAKDYDSVIRIHLDHLQNPEEAVRIVNETKSVEGAKMVAKFFQKMGDFASAIQFLVLSHCNDDAFLLAQEHNQMEQYVEVIGESSTAGDYNSIALHFERKGQHFLAGKFFHLAGQYNKAISHFIQCNVNEHNVSIDYAIETVGMANDDKLTHTLIDYLMGELDGNLKDFKYLFRLYMALKRYKEAARTAIIIAKDDQEAGNYRTAHDVLFSMYKELKERNIKIPAEMDQNLMLLHSYILVKIHVRRGDHAKGARMLIRVANNISKFPAHIVPILTSTVIECHRAGLKHSSFSYAAMLMRPEYRQQIDLKYKKKIEQIVRKPDKTEEEEPVDSCPHCSHPVPQSRLDCPECKNNLPYCIITGRHMVKDDWVNCPNCSFPAVCSEFKSFLEGDDTNCPMCSEKVTINSLKAIHDSSSYLKQSNDGDDGDD